MLNLIYQILTFIISLAVLPLFYIFPRGRFKLQQRFGYWLDTETPITADSKLIWLHASSYGEVNAVSPVVSLLRKKYPEYKILITTTSDTGYKKAAEIADYVRICPFDNYIWIKNAFHKIRPQMLIVTETEIWPAMLHYTARAGIPAYLINARISDYSLPYYKIFRKFLAPLLNNFKIICVINQESRDRLLILGAEESRIRVCGYSKYDIQPAVSTEKEAKQLKNNYFQNSYPVITLGSIRPTEEDIWFKAISRAYKSDLKFNLVVVPRHLDKVTYFEEKLQQYEIGFIKYSDLKEPAANTLLLDAMGKLNQVYSFTDLAFIGASLVNIGGHNPLEPACYKSAICIGPFYNNVREIVEKLIDEKAISVIKDSDSAFNLIESVCRQDTELLAASERAHNFWKANYGSGDKIVQLLDIT